MENATAMGTVDVDAVVSGALNLADKTITRISRSRDLKPPGRNSI